MLRQKCSYRNDNEPCQNLKSKEKIKLSLQSNKNK